MNPIVYAEAAAQIATQNEDFRLFSDYGCKSAGTGFPPGSHDVDKARVLGIRGDPKQTRRVTMQKPKREWRWAYYVFSILHVSMKSNDYPHEYSAFTSS